MQLFRRDRIGLDAPLDPFHQVGMVLHRIPHRFDGVRVLFEHVEHPTEKLEQEVTDNADHKNGSESWSKGIEIEK